MPWEVGVAGGAASQNSRPTLPRPMCRPPPPANRWARESHPRPVLSRSCLRTLGRGDCFRKIRQSLLCAAGIFRVNRPGKSCGSTALVLTLAGQSPSTPDHRLPPCGAALPMLTRSDPCCRNIPFTLLRLLSAHISVLTCTASTSRSPPRLSNPGLWVLANTPM